MTGPTDEGSTPGDERPLEGMPADPPDDTVPGWETRAPVEPPASEPDETGPTEPADDAAEVDDDVEEPVARGLVVVGETPGVDGEPPVVEEPETETEAVTDAEIDDAEPAEEERDPARVWKIAAAVLAVLVVVLGVIAIASRGDDAKATPPVTTDQEAHLDAIAKADDKLEAKRAQIEALKKEGADLAAASKQLESDNAGLQSDLDTATAAARDAEAKAAAALTEAAKHRTTAAEANRQLDTLAGQVESLNREIGSLTTETDRLSQQNASLQKANQDLVARNDRVTAQLTALDGVQQKTYQCTRGLVGAVQQRDDPGYWEQNGDAITQDCTAAQAALDAYNAEFGR